VAKDKKNPVEKKSRKGICCNTGRTHFKKGFVPWNAGKAGTYKHKKKRRFIPLPDYLFHTKISGILTTGKHFVISATI